MEDAEARSDVRRRMRQMALLSALFIIAWFGMQAVHELGHVAAAWLTGGTIQHVVLHPLAISRTDVSPNPHPLTVAWSGPIVGCLAPLIVWAAAARVSLTGQRFFEFFAGFCLIANGSYIVLGTLDGVGDAGELLRHGAPAWMLYLIGSVALVGGLGIWRRASGEFGFGRSPRAIAVRDAVVAWAVAVATAMALLALGNR